MNGLAICKAIGLALTAVFAAVPAFGGTSTTVDTAVVGKPHDALFAVAIDGATGIAVGAAGATYDSVDAGASWTPGASPTALSLLGVAVRQATQLAVGQMGTILRRDLATGPWQEIDSGTSERLLAVSLNTTGVAVAVGSFGTILKSADGGRSWRSIAPDWTSYTVDGAQPHLYDAKVDERGAITVAGEFGLILRSEPGRPGWRLLHRGQASIFALDLRSDGIGYAVGQSGLAMRTANGGTSWTRLDTNTEANLLAVSSAADGRVTVTGMRDAIASRDDGKSWQHITSGDIGAAWYSGVAQAGPGAPLLAVGTAGKIIRIRH